MHSKPVKEIFNRLLIILFCGCILSSPAAMLLNKTEHWSNTEKRLLAIPPSLPTHITGYTNFFKATDRYFNDHFGFREFFISRYQRELNRLFDKTSSTSLVTKGLEGWYFLNAFGLIDDFLGQTPLTQNQLHDWLAELQKRDDWLRDRGIHYLYLIAPNKQSIYPQYLDKNASAIKGISRFEQLLEYTGNTLPEYMINAHSLLRPKQFDTPLYYKNDSHWNKFAAYIVFREMIEKISDWFPDIEFQTEFDFIDNETGIGGNTGHGGDLVNMLMQPDLTETYPQLKQFKPCGTFRLLPYPLTNITQSSGRESFERKCPSGKLKVVIFRDSFFVTLEPFFSENLAEIIYLWKGYDQHNIEELLTYFKPDIVIETVIERHAFDFLQK